MYARTTANIKQNIDVVVENKYTKIMLFLTVYVIKIQVHNSIKMVYSDWLLTIIRSNR